jgi:hypothetical protein
MSRDKSRTLFWGKGRRPKISNRLGSPNPREGSDGDIEVRQTGLGARLFAKLGGRWLSNILHGGELDSPDVCIPKIWQGELDPPLSSVSDVDVTNGMAYNADPIKLYLPDYINSKNFLSANLSVRLLSVSGVTLLQSWGTPDADAFPEVWATMAYHPTHNYVGIQQLSWHSHLVSGSILYEASSNGVFVDTTSGKKAKIIITVFFK